MPIALAKLVQSRSKSGIDLGAEVRELLADGRRRITIGLGPGVDVPLLDEELHAAEIADLDRELVVAAIRAEPDGYVVERGETNFGVYVWTELHPLWETVRFMAEIRGLRPGDEVALGSTPAEAVKFVLPESSLVPPPRARRSARTDLAREQQRARSVTPTSASERRPRIRDSGPTPPTAPGRTWVRRVQRDRWQRLFDAALLHWRYAMITFGGDERAVLHLDDPELASLRAAVARNLEQPERGYEVFVKDPTPSLWVEVAGQDRRQLGRGEVVKLRGPGNRIGFGPYAVELPPPAVPVPRFGPRQTPTRAEVAEVLGLRELDLLSSEIVKERYRALVRRFHPDRHDGDPGHTSRFLEIQAALRAWKA